jgi:hypothetical protein
MTFSRRQIIAGAAASAAVAAVPVCAIAEVVETAPVLSGGRALLHGAFEPEDIGVDGDFYVDIITNDVWHRARGTWKMIFDYAVVEARDD